MSQKPQKASQEDHSEPKKSAQPEKPQKETQEERAAPASAPKAQSAPKKRARWNKSGAGAGDSLLFCLEVMSTLLERPMSAAAFRAGLPLENEKMSPEHFIRAAAKAGLSARLVQKKLSEISPYTLPCVVLLEGDKACILAEITPQGEAKIILPESGKGATTLALEDLELLYDGYAIFARPLYRYDKRSSDLDLEKPKSWFWGVIWKFWPVYSKVAFAAILVNLFAIASPLFTMNVYDRVVPNGDRATDTLIVLAIGIGIVFLFDFILKSLRVYFVDSAGKNADIILASRLLEHVMGIQLGSRPPSSGSFANQLREFETLREFFSSASLVALIDLPFIALFIAVIYFIGGSIAWVPVIAIPIVILGSVLIHIPLSAWVRRAFRESAQKHALLVETINGLETIKSFGAEGQTQQDWERFVAQSADSSRYLKFFATLAMNWSGLIQQLGYVAVIIVGVFLIGEGNLTMGGLIACSILTSRAMAPLGQVVGLLTRFNQSQTALEALDQVLALPVERPHGKRFLHRPTLKGDIEFSEVSFSYPEQKTTALKDFNLKIKAGEKVGFLGRIGSGKSTFEKLLLNLYEPTTGSIKIDGTDIRQIDPADLRANMGHVPQDIYLFYGSVKDNILLGARNVENEALLKAAEIAGVLDFVRAHPQGFDLQVGEGGKNLSGGQRQSIAVARALVRNPSIYMMDEPTAMMDHASEARLLNRLKAHLEDKTLLLVTHRMPLVRLVNRLVVVDAGRVVADGPRDEVIKALSKSQIRGA